MGRTLYLAAGDSVTAGSGASHPGFSFVRLVSDFTKQTRLSTETLTIAKSGWTTQDLWNAMQSLPPETWRRVNVLTLLTGGNDLRRLLLRQYFSLSAASITPQLVDQRLQQFKLQMDRLCAYIARQQVPHVAVATVYNPIPNSQLAVSAIDALNTVTHEIANRYQFGVVEVQSKFLRNEPYYIDGYRSGRLQDLTSPVRRPIHPNNAGHRQIADLITSHLAAACLSNPPRNQLDTSPRRHAATSATDRARSLPRASRRVPK